MTSSQDLFPRLLAFIQEAGAYALAQQGKAAQHAKGDGYNNVVTDTDLAISKMCHETFADVFADGDHLLLDEETIGDLGTPAVSGIADAPYIWSLDPVDGTMPYANGLPNFGVSLGVLKHGRPWLGVVYLPAIGELYCADGTRAWLTKNPFTKAAQEIEITPVTGEVHREIPCDIAREVLRAYAWDGAVAAPITLNAAVLFLNWAAMGRLCGAVCRLGPWDWVGSWPMLAAAGLEFHRLSDGKVMGSLTPDWLADDWKTAEPTIICQPRHFATLKKGLIDLANVREKVA